ncbi:MAG: class I tRNA ligase family protein [Planctomycetota bacterium]
MTAATNAVLKAPEGSPHFPSLEESILEFWDQHDIYQASLRQRAGGPSFVFFEGPPTANGLPHPGHCLTRAIKDVFPRYKTMKGFRCVRKAGWDTHGLPVEVEVSKELGIHDRTEIVDFGEEAFIQKCQQSVFRYIGQWRTMTRRLGFWVDLDEAYVTYHQSYVESVWWSLKNLFDRGLLYYGHKIVWWWAQGGTALSQGEVGDGYREVADPSVYVKFPLVDHPGRSLVVWTTTPWTLPSNTYAAVHPSNVQYCVVKDVDGDGDEWVLAKDLVETIAGKIKRDLPIIETLQTSDLIGARYRPPFDHFVQSTGDPHADTRDGGNEAKYWKVVGADIVTTDSGTGIVHMAPAFGQADYEVYQAERDKFVDDDPPELLYCVGPDGKFTDVFPPVAGLWVKDADKPICNLLKEQGRMVLLDQYLHDYPFCWRAKEDPLIQYPRSGWFLRTTRFKDMMLENNQHIGWQPEHIRNGRFGNFLESNVDWELSRERFWGTPLPIWVCEKTGRAEAVDRYDSLLQKPGVTGTEVWENAKAASPDLVDDLKVHKPYIDAITYDSPFAEGARMRRVGDVIDCWYDSGSMPFAQWGWPHQNDAEFQNQYPADFISEAIDQTRGWFYSQLAIATMLFGKGSEVRVDDQESHSLAPEKNLPAGASLPQSDYPLPFRNCIVLGLMLGEDGNKMSKKDRNYREPSEIFDKYGADALRWFLFSGQTPWTAIRYREQTIKDSIPEFLLRLWNVYSFLCIYAEIDGFDPTTADVQSPGGKPMAAAEAGYRPIAQRPEIDRWVLSELHRTIATVTERMDALDNYNACTAINEFVDAVSNWYVRRTRDRFWSYGATGEHNTDKLDAYWTLYEVLIQISKLIAPMVPFLAETIWQRLTQPGPSATGPEQSAGESNANAAAAAVANSVHLCDYPVADPAVIDPQLSESMSLLREIASLGRAARADAKLKVRLPLSGVEVVLGEASAKFIPWLQSHDELVRDELNVKSVDYTTDGKDYVDYKIVPNFRALGPKAGKAVPLVKKQLAQMDGGELLSKLQQDGRIVLDLDGREVELTAEDIEVRLSAREGWAAAQGRRCVVVLNTEVTDELREEGLAKDLIRVIQNQRKAIACEYTDRIEVGVVTQDTSLLLAIEKHGEKVCSETLANTLGLTELEDTEPVDFEDAKVFVKKASM